MSRTDEPFDDEPDDQPGRSGALGRPFDPRSPDLLSLLGVAVPDDASELDDDLRTLQLERLARHPSSAPAVVTVGTADAPAARRSPRERLLRAPREAWHRLIGSPGRPGPAAAPLLAVCLLSMVGVLAGLLTLMSPRVTLTAPSALPIASPPEHDDAGAGAGADDRAGSAAGTSGTVRQALLPAGRVRRAGVELPSRDLRPAALLVARDPRCATCEQTLKDVVADARELALPVALVVPDGLEDVGDEVVRGAVGRDAEVISDLDGSLVEAYAGDADTKLVLVHADGVVADPGTHDPERTDEPELEPLLDAGATPEADVGTSVR